MAMLITSAITVITTSISTVISPTFHVLPSLLPFSASTIITTGMMNIVMNVFEERASNIDIVNTVVEPSWVIALYPTLWVRVNERTAGQPQVAKYQLKTHIDSNAAISICCLFNAQGHIPYVHTCTYVCIYIYMYA